MSKIDMTKSAIETIRKLNELSDEELKKMFDEHTEGELGQLVARAVLEAAIKGQD